MTSPGYDQARVERRRREHERQAVVFGVLIAFLAVCGIFALAVYSGAISSPFNRPFTTVGAAEQKTYPVPCLPAVKGQPDGALPATYSDVQIRLLNASEEIGLASAHETVLADRGFSIISKGNVPVQLQESEIRFGRKGIVQAYTLAAQFPEIRLVLDDRRDRKIDLLIGEEFEAPLDVEDVELTADKPLINAEDCVPSGEIEPEKRIEPSATDDEDQPAK
ncbi:LytR C-terminal domain-containing protein [Promicromonospora sukumoe]|uniref:LytR C-terminal domain-containing protein n=1 Tax=Promicromonospora sukumoe TaxID=88382 RepID=UPI0012FC304A|nr:LytR C-terminal domain-containing protein [Promicromonospora sukumoe]